MQSSILLPITSLRAQGDGKDAAAADQLFKQAWARADVEPTVSYR